jgi:hypothetical protein
MTISENSLWSTQSNTEISNYLNSITSVLGPNGSITAGGNTDMIERAIYNISA